MSRESRSTDGIAAIKSVDSNADHLELIKANRSIEGGIDYEITPLKYSDRGVFFYPVNNHPHSMTNAARERSFCIYFSCSVDSKKIGVLALLALPGLTLTAAGTGIISPFTEDASRAVVNVSCS